MRHRHPMWILAGWAREILCDVIHMESPFQYVSSRHSKQAKYFQSKTYIFIDLDNKQTQNANPHTYISEIMRSNFFFFFNWAHLIHIQPYNFLIQVTIIQTRSQNIRENPVQCTHYHMSTRGEPYIQTNTTESPNDCLH